MKNLLFVSFCLFSMVSFGQIENPSNSVEIEAAEDNFETPNGLELPASKLPSLSNKKDNRPNTESTLGQNNQDFDMTQGDGLRDYKTNKPPKAFTKDSEMADKEGGNQNLGSVTTKTGSVTVMYRDYQFVDGDRIRVYINEDVVRSNEYLSGSFKGFTIPLQDGLNIIDFQALNQGDSGPNTAELHVYDENGQIISAKEWNLLTGYKATITVVKE